MFPRFLRASPSAAAAILAAALAFAGPVEAEIYKWVDENGALRFTDDPSAIPKGRSGEVLRIEPSDRPPSRAPEPESRGTGYIPEREPGPDEAKTFMAKMSPLGEGFTVEAGLNGAVKARLLVDTGASIVIISPETARRLGYSRLEDLPRLPVSTAGGVSWIWLIVLESVKVERAEVWSVEAGISPNFGRGMDGLLGMSFLKEFGYRLDAAAKELTLTPLAREGRTYGGYGKAWWMGRYHHYARNIRRFSELLDKMARGVSASEDPRMRKAAGFDEEGMKKLVNYYRGLFERLERRASRYGVPLEWRMYP
ncbi:MAG: retroviral-like aspartic protease family protein [Candidatus Nitrospinota bacterium M3_3B_026]